MNICFTGKLSKFTRDEACALAQDAGYKIENGVTQHLDILVVADPNSNSLKLQKARKFGIEIISEDEFLKRTGKDLEGKYLKKKEDKKEADITWEKLLKKICRKVGIECSILNQHIKEYSWKKDYRVNTWEITIHKRNDANPIYYLASNTPMTKDWAERSDKETECKRAIADLFKSKIMLESSPHIGYPNAVSSREAREREALRDLPLFTEDDIQKILNGSPNHLKLKLEILGWNNMLDL